MAEAISSPAASSLPKVDKAGLYEKLQYGDTLFWWGNVTISHIIEDLTKGPSHVLMTWLSVQGTWLTIESTIDKGVHVGLLADYMDYYPGGCVLCRRDIPSKENFREIEKGLSLLDDSYDWKQEVSITARKLIKELPLIQPKNELYCSGLRYVQSTVTSVPLQKPASNMPTPQDNFTDPSMVAVCAMVR